MKFINVTSKAATMDHLVKSLDILKSELYDTAYIDAATADDHAIVDEVLEQMRSIVTPLLHDAKMSEVVIGVRDQNKNANTAHTLSFTRETKKRKVMKICFQTCFELHSV